MNDAVERGLAFLKAHPGVPFPVRAIEEELSKIGPAVKPKTLAVPLGRLVDRGEGGIERAKSTYPGKKRPYDGFMAPAKTGISPGDIRTRADIIPVFGGSPYGGICPAVAQRNVVLYSDKDAGKKFGYHDGWLAEEDEHGRVFEYTAAGTSGNQTFGGKHGGNNSAVLRHAEQGRTLRLFVAVGTVPGSDTKTHRYVGAFKLDEHRPYDVRMARDESGTMRKVIVFRLRPDGLIGVVEDDMISPAPQTSSVLVPADATAAKMIEPERNKSKKGYRSATPATEADRREAALSDILEAFLKSHQHEVYRFEIQIEGKTSRLLTDLYDATTHVLYELKGSSRRESVRMALGQLLDYSRYISVERHVGPPRMVGLFPTPLEKDLQELLARHGVGTAWLNGDSFAGVLLSVSLAHQQATESQRER